MIKPPQELIDAFFKWLQGDPHIKQENYYKDIINETGLKGLSKKEFIDFFAKFIEEGGMVQSGGQRFRDRFKEEITGKYEKFRKLVMEPFQKNFDPNSWLIKAKEIKFFGKGGPTIYLNRVDSKRFSIVNNKTKGALHLLGESVPTDLEKAYGVVNKAQRQLIDWYPEFKNFYYADAFNHFLVGEKEGQALAKKLLSQESSPQQPPSQREQDQKNVKSERRLNIPLNLILYGPPGTGKTYTLRTEYFDRFTARQQRKTKEKYAEEIAEQTSWWEIVAIALIELHAEKVSAIMKHPLLQAKIRVTNNKFPRAAVWAMLQTHTKTDCQNVQYTRRVEPLIFSKDKNSVWSIDLDLVKADLAELLEKLDSYNKFSGEETDEQLYVFTTFHQSYSYEEFVEGIKPVIEDQGGDVASGQVSYQIKPGIFKTIVEKARRDPSRSYAIFIDEISRGNVASIFGELITLIEEDKRDGAKNKLIAHLPYSREDFSVPQNLHIIGTMNTADRSVVALDNALRRRFSFREMIPNPQMIKQPNGFAVKLQMLLETINGRIERLLDRDHLIGHSYFMEVVEAESPLQSLQHIFANRILPLLQEYFYGDPAKIGMVLGEAFIQSDGEGIAFAQGPWDEDAFEDRVVYRFIDPLTIDEAGFCSIYE